MAYTTTAEWSWRALASLSPTSQAIGAATALPREEERGELEEDEGVELGKLEELATDMVAGGPPMQLRIDGIRHLWFQSTLTGAMLREATSETGLIGW